MNLPAKISSQLPAPRFSTDQVGLIKRTICKGATDDELQLFMYQAERTGLDPLARQIYAVKRWDSKERKEIMAIQTSIDGFRLVAERSGKYAGQVGPFWCGEDGQWQDVWVGNAPPTAARVGALRSDFKEPCWGVARFDAYAQKNKEGQLTRMWSTMGDVMIAKCAEALALRKAFPQELSGLYTSDEMDQATVIEPEAKPAAKIAKPVEPPMDPQTGELGPHQIAWNDNALDWGARYIAAIKSADMASDLAAWQSLNKDALAIVQRTAPKAYKSITAAHEMCLSKFTQQAAE